MKYRVKYSNLLLNTMLDTIKREKRRVIDGEDIINFERIIRKIVKENDIPLEFEELQNGKNFIKELEPYIFIIEEKVDAKYVLLPWIDEAELEQVIQNTIFVDMSYVYDRTREELRFKRDTSTIQGLRDIERQVSRNFLALTKENILYLERQKSNEEDKLQKIKRNLSIRD